MSSLNASTDPAMYQYPQYHTVSGPTPVPINQLLPANKAAKIKNESQASAQLYHPSNTHTMQYQYNTASTAMIPSSGNAYQSYLPQINNGVVSTDSNMMVAEANNASGMIPTSQYCHPAPIVSATSSTSPYSQKRHTPGYSSPARSRPKRRKSTSVAESGSKSSGHKGEEGIAINDQGVKIGATQVDKMMLIIQAQKQYSEKLQKAKQSRWLV